MRRSFLVALICALTSSAAAAQIITGQFSGTVTDASGGVLPGVTITITNDDTGLTRTAVTDSNGSYVITALPVGRYTVAAELQGFRKAQRTGFELNAGIEED